MSARKTGAASGRAPWAKRCLRRLASVPAIGVPAALTLHALGAERLGRRCARACDYVPAVARIRVPACFGGGEFRMSSAHRADTIVRDVWLDGWDSFERPLPALFAACTRSARLVFDVGANSGYYALLAAACGAAAVHAFEPFTPARALLKTNIRLSRRQRQIRVRRQAVCEDAGRVKLYVPAPQGQISLLETSCSLRRDFRPAHARVLDVPAVSLDGYAAEAHCGPVDVLKIDVEGAEHRVLQGALRTLHHDRPVVFVEVLDVANLDALDEIRIATGYELFVPLGTELHEAERVEYQPDAWNQILCPPEKHDLLAAAAVLAGCALRVGAFA